MNLAQALLGERDVLDQAAERQLAHSRALAGLIVGDALGRLGEEVSRCGEGLEDVGAFAGQRGHVWSSQIVGRAAARREPRWLA